MNINNVKVMKNYRTDPSHAIHFITQSLSFYVLFTMELHVTLV